MTTENAVMTEDRFIDLLNAYGADPYQWPESERKAAVELMESGTARIHSALVEARALDDYLALATTPPVSDDLRNRLHRSARPGLANRLRGLLGWDGSLWQPATALTAALVLGVSLGIANPQQAIALTNLAVESSDTSTTDGLLEEDDTL